MNESITKEVSELVQIGDKLAEDAHCSGSSLGPLRIQELLSITARGGRLIEQLYGSESAYFRMFENTRQTGNFTMMHSNYHRHVSELVGIFKGIKSDIESGMLTNVRNIIQADIFSDFLEMAEYLHEKNYKDAAAILLGATLENSLRKIAETNGVSIHDAKGRHKTIDPLNMDLAKKDVYDKLIMKQITTWANIRNDAVHGHFTKYDSGQVKQMLIFVQKFCSDYIK